ncbi:MAG: peptidylprolyl isomerase [Alphaproteobacteria bacterium]|nr:MAG: peptidylprolyl isomerase [Alphaproteobacteria bacterium]
MTKAAQGDTVRVHYTGTLKDGSQFDSSEGQEPITVTIGEGRVIPGFEEALVGMEAGESKTVTIPADEAYGPHRNDLLHKVSRAQVPPEIELEVGGAVFVRGPEGEPIRLTVVALDDETVTLDANHPLAGEDLTFRIELVEKV